MRAKAAGIGVLGLVGLVLTGCVPVEAGDRVVVVPRDRVIVVPDRERESERGPFVRCRLSGGEIRFGGRWAPYVPAEFTLGRDDVERVRVVRRDGRRARTLWVRRSADGRTIRLCDRDPAEALDARCVRVRFERGALREGVRVRIDRRRLFRDVTLSCESLRRPRPQPVRPRRERLQCTLAGGQVRFLGGELLSHQPAQFSVRRGEEVGVIVWNLRGEWTRAFAVRWTPDGRRLEICTAAEGPARHCTALEVPATRRFRASNIDIPPAAYDFELRCRRR